MHQIPIRLREREQERMRSLIPHHDIFNHHDRHLRNRLDIGTEDNIRLRRIRDSNTIEQVFLAIDSHFRFLVLKVQPRFYVQPFARTDSLGRNGYFEKLFFIRKAVDDKR